MNDWDWIAITNADPWIKWALIVACVIGLVIVVVDDILEQREKR